MAGAGEAGEAGDAAGFFGPGFLTTAAAAALRLLLSVSLDVSNVTSRITSPAPSVTSMMPGPFRVLLGGSDASPSAGAVAATSAIFLIVGVWRVRFPTWKCKSKEMPSKGVRSSVQ
jgi:hypothetical protein